MLNTAPNALVTTYLEMTHREQFRPTLSDDPRIRVEPMQSADVSFYRFLYRAVGEKWRWRDRLTLSGDDLRRILNRETTQVHVLYYDGSPAGYVELNRDSKRSVEIAYFGLREEYMGRGLGKHLLSYGIQQAWAMGAERIWLHTCNLDGPHALSNYQKRGFRIYMSHEEPMPETYF